MKTSGLADLTPKLHAEAEGPHYVRVVQAFRPA